MTGHPLAASCCHLLRRARTGYAPRHAYPYAHGYGWAAMPGWEHGLIIAAITLAIAGAAVRRLRTARRGR